MMIDPERYLIRSMSKPGLMNSSNHAWMRRTVTKT